MYATKVLFQSLKVLFQSLIVLFQSLIVLTMKVSLNNACTKVPALEHGYHYYVAAPKSSQVQVGSSANALIV